MAADGAPAAPSAGAGGPPPAGAAAGPSDAPDTAPAKRSRDGEPAAAVTKRGKPVPGAAPMDQRAVDYTRAHYDAHARPAVSTAAALRERAGGEALPLKKYHNTIKRALIDTFAGGAPRLLDLACGRGGDIHKWIGAGVGYALGVDLSPGEIEEARRRFDDSRAKRADSMLTAKFEVCDSLGTAPFHRPPAFNAVTCMFAAHYFFATEASASRFLANVAANLEPGGHFIGTVPSGKRVMAAIKGGGKWPLLATRLLRLEAHWAGAPTPFGCGYSCAIGDTVTAAAAGGEGGGGGSFEYLVFFSAFAALAASHGLDPVGRWPNPALERLLDPGDEGAAFKHFAPHFPGADPSLERASELFAAFVFRKRDKKEKKRE